MGTSVLSRAYLKAARAREHEALRARGIALGLVGLSLVAAVLAGSLHVLLFGDGSPNNDEVVYRLQASALAEGQLFPRLPDPPSAYQPWFYAIRDGEAIGKYTPVTPALYAASLAVSGSLVPALCLVTGLLPVAVYALGRSITMSRRSSLVAAGLTSLSPLVIMQSAQVLAYIPTLALLLAAWAALARYAHVPTWRWGALAGLAASVAAWSRPYDGVLFLAPPLLLAAWRARRSAVSLLAMCAGAAPVVAAALAYNARATGSPLRLPFNLLEPSDGVGFGTRRFYPEAPPRLFDPPDGITGGLHHFGSALFLWSSAGALLVALLVLLVVRRKGDRPAEAEPAPGDLARKLRRALAVSAGLIFLGYLPFWGPWHASFLWRGVAKLGPFYGLPVVAAVALLGMAWITNLHRARRTLATALITLTLVVNGGQLAYALLATGRNADRTRDIIGAIRSLPEDAPVLVSVDPPYLGHPPSLVINDLAGPPRFSLESQMSVEEVRGRGSELYGLQVLGIYKGPSSWSLTRLTWLRGQDVQVRVHHPNMGTGTLVVERAGRWFACSTTADDTALVHLRDSVRSGCPATRAPRAWTRPQNDYRRCPTRDCLALAWYQVEPGEGTELRAWRRVPVKEEAGTITILADAEVIAEETFGAITLTKP